MSTDTENVEERSFPAVLETWQRWFHVPVIGVAMVFMLLSRLRAYERVTMDDGLPRLSAVDSWYHWRTLQWTAENYPRTMPYEVWTGFPSGRYVGQFGTLFDQLIVTVAMIVGFGDPSTETLYTVSLIAVPVLGTLVAIPVFYMGRRLGKTIGGIVSVVLLALFSGEFFRRSLTGNVDHHIGEVLFMAIAVLAMMVALRVAEREKPIYELVANREWEAIREPAIYSALAGLALSLYIWVWPSAVLLVGIFGVFFAVHLCHDFVRGISPDHVAFVGAVSMGVTAVITVILLEEPSTSVTSFGYLQPVTALLVGVGCVFMAWLARQWEGRDLERYYYPAAIVGLIAVLLGAMAIVLPEFYSTIMRNLTSRLLPLDPSTGTLTIAEGQPPDNFPQRAVDEFGTAFYTMLAGLVFLVVRPFLGREYRAEYTLVIVWSLFLLSMAMTQVRFFYYLALGVAVVNAVFVADIVRLFDLERSVESLRALETYQVITLLLVVVLLFAPLLPPVASVTAWDMGTAASPSDDAMVWEEANHWLKGNTPEPGNWAGAGNDSELDYYGTYDYPDGGDYEYPDGSYGVMSWWDYGHLITVQGERIPHANPFQQNARPASAFLTAQSEERGELILDAIAAGETVRGQSTAELEELADSESHEDVRYVMIDHEMATGKFYPITQWTGPGYGAYFSQQEYVVGENDTQTLPAPDAYYDTMMATMYLHDSVGLEHYRLVHENDDYAVVRTSMNQFGTPILDSTRVTNMGVGGTQLDGTWNNQTQAYAAQWTNDRVNGRVSQGFGGMWDPFVVSSVKTFERVEGATITGSVDDQNVVDDENATVYAMLELETAPGRTFTYGQEAQLNDDGSFELTVPYATNDELGPDDGYTNSSVHATGNYEVFVGTPTENGSVDKLYEGEAAVPETAVVDGETIDPVTLEQVEDEETVTDPTEPEGTDDPDGEPSDDNDGDEEPADNETAGDGVTTDGNDSDSNESEGEGESGNENETDTSTNAIAPIRSR